MPKYVATEEDEDLYGDVKAPGAVPRGTKPDQSAAPKPEEAGEPETTDQETAESQNSAVIANKVLTGPDGEAPKEGDEIILKVIKNYGDECEVAYAPKKPTGSDEGPTSDSEIEAMDTPMD